MPTFAPGTKYYVAVALVNNQSTPTPANFQCRVVVNSSLYSTNLATNLANVNWQDGSGNIFASWLESGETNGSTNTVYWVNLGASTIAGSGGTLTIYYCLFDTSDNEMDGTNTGAEPNYTGTYGQHDNGTNVFAYYTNFNGVSLPSGWSTSLGGSGSATVNDGVTLAVGGTVDDAWIYRTASQSPTKWFETYLISQSGAGPYGMCGWAISTPPSSNHGYNQYAMQCANTNTVKFYRWLTGAGSLLGSTTENQPFVWGVAWAATGNERGHANYSEITSTNADLSFSNSYAVVGVYGNGGSSSMIIRWARTRLYPPSDTMPSASFGSLTPIVPPTSIVVTDTALATDSVAVEVATTVTVSDSGTASESVGINVLTSVVVVDLAHASESVEITLPSYPIMVVDSAHATDSIRIFGITRLVVDSAVASESVTIRGIARVVLIVDQAYGQDDISVARDV